MAREENNNIDDRLINVEDMDAKATDIVDLNVFEFEVEDIAFTSGEYRTLH